MCIVKPFLLKKLVKVLYLIAVSKGEYVIVYILSPARELYNMYRVTISVAYLAPSSLHSLLLIFILKSNAPTWRN